MEEMTEDTTIETHLPIRWIAPESMERPAKYSCKTDVWSFGVCLWELFRYDFLHCNCVPEFRSNRIQSQMVIFSVMEKHHTENLSHLYSVRKYKTVLGTSCEFKSVCVTAFR